MNTRGCKAKGRRLQNWIRDQILGLFPELVGGEAGDVRPALMGESGRDIKFSPRALELLPYAIEAKNVEKLNVWTAYDQAKTHDANSEPLLIIKKNGRVPLACVDAKHFLKLIRRLHE